MDSRVRGNDNFKILKVPIEYRKCECRILHQNNPPNVRPPMPSKIKHSQSAVVKGRIRSAPTPANTSSPTKPSMLPRAISTLILGVGLYRAIALKWISDDAFITLRYVKNIIEGHGFVYNVGERVEGYTHFLWLLMLTAARAIGFDTVDASIWLGIIAYCGIIVVFLAIARKEQARNSRPYFLPIAAALLALNYDMNVWASGGLETAFYALLISLSFYAWFYISLTNIRRLPVTGTLLFLATLTRPDGALFTITAVILLIILRIRQKHSVLECAKQCALLLAPSILIGIPYLLWKYSYYGDILPTTYYAKSGGGGYTSQGLFYVWQFFTVYVTAGLGLLAALAIAFAGKRFLRDEKPVETQVSNGSPLITALVAVAVYLLVFVVRVGGDFMFARFIIPVLPLIYFAVERAVDYLPTARTKWSVALALVAAVLGENQWRDSILFHREATTGELQGNWDFVNTYKPQNGIADERWVYYHDRFELGGTKRGSLDVYSEVGKFDELLFAGLPVTMAIPGAQNMVAYYGNFPTCINEFGLTDSYIAHLPITAHGRIGHEKKAPEEYLIKRGVQFELGTILAKIPETPSYTLAAFELPESGVWQTMRVVSYDKAVIDELHRRVSAVGGRCLLPKYEVIMPSYINQVMQTLPVEQVEEDYKGFTDFYFKKYPDPQAQRIIETYIAKKKAEK